MFTLASNENDLPTRLPEDKTHVLNASAGFTTKLATDEFNEDVEPLSEFVTVTE
jgi:hypothetical protein